MIRLYLDPNYPKSVVHVLTSLESIQFPQRFEIVTGKWLDEFTTTNTAVFLIDLNKKGFNPVVESHIRDGYKVIAYKKPLSAAFDPYNCALTLVTYWRRILDDVARADGQLLISLSSSGNSYRIVK